MILKFEDFITESKGYTFIGTCVDWDENNIDDLQNITGFDDFADNEYSIIDDKLENGTIEIIDKTKFDELTGGFDDFSSDVVYYAINHDYDIVFAYCDDDVHYFFEK